MGYITVYELYWKEFLGWACAWFLLQFSARYFFRLVNPGVIHSIKRRCSTSPRKERNLLRALEINSVAIVHAAFTSAYALFHIAFPEPELIADRIYGGSRRSLVLFQMSAGYFVHDFVNGVLDRDITFVLHGAIGFLGYSQSCFPFIQHYAILIWLYEISTVFLHIRFYLIQTDRGEGAFFSLVQNLFGYSFLFFRILVGLPISLVYILPDLLHLALVGTPPLQDRAFSWLRAGGSGSAAGAGAGELLISAATVWQYIASNVVLHALNLFWAWRVIQLAKKPASDENEMETGAGAGADASADAKKEE